MTGFLKSYADIRTSDGRNATLLQPIYFQRPDAVGGDIYKVPVGATTDGGSEPPIFWPIGFAPFGSDTWLGYLLHDAAFRGTIVPLVTEFEVANLLLYEALSCLGCAEFKRRAIYAGVTSKAGRAVWDDYRRTE